MEYLEQNEIQIRFLRFNLVLGTTEATTKVNSLGLQNTTWDTGKTFSFSMREFFSVGEGKKSFCSTTNCRVDDQWLFASTMHVLVGIYTCTQFFLPFHSIGVVKNLPSNAILSNPPNLPSSLLKTIPYSPASSTPTR